jgi:hypothetical protein
VYQAWIFSREKDERQNAKAAKAKRQDGEQIHPQITQISAD